MKYVIEPMALALSPEASEQEFKVYVNRLLQWEEWIERFPEDVYMLSDTGDLLAMEGFFPVYDVFSSLMSKYNINYVRVADLNRAIQKVLSKAKKLDFKDRKNSVEGDFIIEKMKTGLKKKEVGYPEPMWLALERTLRCIFCRCENEGGKKEASFVLFGRSVPPVVSYEVEHQAEDKATNGFVKQRVKGCVMGCASLKDFFCHKKAAIRVLQTHRHKDDLDLAFRVAAYQKRPLLKVVDVFGSYQFYIQDSFYRDFSDAKYRDQHQFLSTFSGAVGNCLTGNQMRDREAFRTGRGGNNPQKVMNGYSAWRWFVTQSVKMQYWQKGSDYRFANIREHDEFLCEWEN